MNLFTDTPSIKYPKQEGYTLLNNNPHKFTLFMPHGELIYFPHFFKEMDSKRILDYLLDNDIEPDNACSSQIKWIQSEIKLFGKKVLEPRLSAWYGDEGVSYTYSGLTLYPNPWNEELVAIKTKVEQALQNSTPHIFNSVLLNWYRDGRDYMGWHADDEKELGKNPLIASVNFGALRRFLLRRNANHNEKVEVELQNGSLLIMKGELQHYWKHTVPKQLRVKTDRINLTFRQIK